MKFGRSRSPSFKHLKLEDYLDTGALPPPPATCDYAQPAAASLGKIYLNDSLGDCVIAGKAHVDGVESANAGAEIVYDDAQILAWYGAIGGYVPGNDATDNGCNMLTALQYWKAQGDIVGWLAIDPTDLVKVKTALWLFENLYMGMELPAPWVTPMPSKSGVIWDVAGAPVPDNGHCVMGAAYDEAGSIKICTWAMLLELTARAIATYATGTAGGELYSIITKKQLAKGATKAPNGVAWDQLLADCAAMGGSVAA